MSPNGEKKKKKDLDTNEYTHLYRFSRVPFCFLIQYIKYGIMVYSVVVRRARYRIALLGSQGTISVMILSFSFSRLWIIVPVTQTQHPSFIFLWQRDFSSLKSPRQDKLQTDVSRIFISIEVDPDNKSGMFDLMGGRRV
jgi:hypothetical protein